MSDASPAPEGAGNTDPPDEGTPDGSEQLGDAGKQALDRMKAQLKEARAKAKNADALQAELDELRATTMSETEKAIEQARKEGHALGSTETALAYGSKLVDAEVRAAAAGRNIDVDVLLEGLDRSRFLTEGEVDSAAIGQWVDKLAPKPGVDSFPDLGQGARPDNQMALNGDPLLNDVKAKLGIR